MDLEDAVRRLREHGIVRAGEGGAAGEDVGEAHAAEEDGRLERAGRGEVGAPAWAQGGVEGLERDAFAVGRHFGGRGSLDRRVGGVGLADSLENGIVKTRSSVR